MYLPEEPVIETTNQPKGLSLPIMGWQEWVGLPDLKTRSIKAKIDTGARSCALHAFNIEIYEADGVDMVRFDIHPFEEDDRRSITTEVELLDQRHVRSSNGEVTYRPVILTTLEWSAYSWPVELTLISRDKMGFRMLIGREALRGRVLVDSNLSFVGGTRRSSSSRKTPPPTLPPLTTT